MKNAVYIFTSVLFIMILTGCSQVGEVIEKSNKLLDAKLEQVEKGEDDRNCCCDCNGKEKSSSVSVDKDDKSPDESNDNQATEGTNKPSINPEDVKAEEYESDQGEEVKLKYGEFSFATGIVDFQVGDPEPDEAFMDASQALGEPNYDASADTGFVSLGGAGTLVVEFDNLYLVDGPGDDLYVFEIGPAVESMFIEISMDGQDWVEIGEISGGSSSVDIGPYVESGDKFNYVKIIDLEDYTGPPSPGEDIAAVAIINGELK